MTYYYVGQTKRLQITFRDASGLVADPTTVQLRVGLETGQAAGGSASALGTWYYASGTITRVSTGVYYRDYTFERTGVNVIEYIASGVPTTKEVLSVQVLQPYVWT